MTFTRQFTLVAAEQIQKLPPQIKRHIRHICDELIKNPYAGKPLREELEGFYSWRHAHYRILYKIENKKSLVIVEYAGRRKNVYEVFSALRRRK